MRYPTDRQWKIGEGEGTGVTTHTDATNGKLALYEEDVVARWTILFLRGLEFLRGLALLKVSVAKMAVRYVSKNMT